MAERSPYSGAEIVGELGEIDLYSNDDEKIGRILEVNPQFIVVERGGFLSGKSEFFIAREYVASESGDRWTLSTSKDELETLGSHERPEMLSDTELADTQNTEPIGTQDLVAAEPATADSAMEGDTQTIQVHEEELEAQKTARSAGDVTITKDIVEETKTIEVPVMREEVRVERRAASDTGPSDHPDAFDGDSITIPVMEEQVEVRKVARAVEEIEVSKVQTQDTETVSDTVRKERVDIDDSSNTTTER
ncbi:MAG: YsnF/AvaK domain-containing protein [Chloroflexota bacterium]|nr:YsnF/AvaK domain-containing protein [Chloroflexota bacterium]